MIAKRFFAMLLSVMISATATQAEIYKAARDFSYLNPSGVWVYGYGQTGVAATFKRFGPIVDGCGIAKPQDCFMKAPRAQIGLNTTNHSFVHGTVLIGEWQLMMHPDTGTDAIVVFKAPRAATYEFGGYFQIMDSSPTGVRLRIFNGQKDVTQTTFGSTVYPAIVPVYLTGPGANLTAFRAGERKVFGHRTELAAGDLVWFGVNPNGDPLHDSVGFNVQVKAYWPSLPSD